MIPAFFEGVPRRLIEGFERAGPAAIGFPPAVNGHRLTSSQYGDSLSELGRRGDEPLALYIHLPFCPVRCLYCACQTTVTHDFEQIDRYLDALEQELDLVLERLGRGRELEQLHLGGGTPNYLNDSQLVRLMGMVALRFRISPKTSPVIECNPRRTSASQLELLHSLGFKGLSLGVQDLNPSVQHAMGRINSP
jgi:oxygen-independent coproporphyrinogen-3 oxidase